MHTTRGVIVKDLVLVGGGHSHVTVIKRFGMRTMPGVRLTVIAREIHTPYSGMLPGLIAGHYTFDEAHIDLEPLARFADARLFHDEVVGLDLARRLVLCRNRPPVGFDILSINIGSTPSLGIAGAAGRVVPVKPISSFMERWERLTARVLASTAPARIGVVGAGAGGVELTLAVQFALGRLLAARGRAAAPDMHLFSATPTILPTHNRRVRAKFARVLRERGVHVHLGAHATRLDEVLWTTEAAAQPWLAASGLAVDERGFVCVDDTLQSTSHPGVFAAGDIAAVVKHPREKSGVFAVRQGPPLEGNLRRALQGRRLKPFRPQMRVLSLITTGDRYAIASRSWWSLEGRYVWTIKDWIDRRFMEKYKIGHRDTEK